MSELKVLQIYRAGRLTVVGFTTGQVLDDMHVMECRDDISQIIQEHKCSTLAFDLTAMKMIPSGLLGLLASVTKQDIEVLIFNPTEDVREVLEITRMDRIMKVMEVDV